MSDIACQATLAFVSETKLLVYNDDYDSNFDEDENENLPILGTKAQEDIPKGSGGAKGHWGLSKR